MTYLPNVRKQFIPELDHVIFDCDLSGADAQVVAWEANDQDLMAAFKSGLKVHIHNFNAMWPDIKFDPAIHKHVVEPGQIFPRYDALKRAVHGTNYGASARTIAVTLGWKIAAAEQFQHRWFTIHPAIKSWHQRVDRQLQTTRTVTNRFGYRRIYFDRMDNLLAQALAWVPQSTVAIVCSRGGSRLCLPEFSTYVPEVIPCLQVHDSLVFQVHKRFVNSRLLRRIKTALEVTVPYPDPLNIQWEISASDRSWGHVESISWDGSDLEKVL